LLDPRIWRGPLQQLELVTPPFTPDFSDASHQHWLVFTSPSSVLAFDAWMHDHAQNLLINHRPRLAAVGGGTAHRLRSMPWTTRFDEIVHVEDSTKASAQSLIDCLLAIQSQESFAWSKQSFVLVEGEDNRPTLAQGLAALGAEVHPFHVYRRTDARWNLPLKDLIQHSMPKEVGLLVTSSTVIDRVLSCVAELRVPMNHVVWLTQHQTIADQLHEKTRESILRVRLDPRYFLGDAFDQPTPW
jgi:uroporphyrinogen-III synthase